MLKLIALNGKLQGSEFELVEGLTIGHAKESDIRIKALKVDLEVHCDRSGAFLIASKSKRPIIELGGELLSKLEALPGLIFSVGETGFSIQESDSSQKLPNQKKFSLTTVLNENFDWDQSLYPLEEPIQFDFVRGALLNTSMKINWHPYFIGAKSNLHHFVDEHIKLEDHILSIEVSTETNNPQTLIRPFISNFILINGHLISKPTIIKNGDLVEFSDTAFYIRIK